MDGLRRAALFILLVLALCGLGLAVPACGTGEIWFTYADAGTDADVDAGPDAADDMCPADACMTVPAGWDGPYLLWSGLNGQEPPCPYDAPYGEAHHAYGDLIAPPACEPCACGPSTGSCTLPSTLTAHDVSCQNLSQPHKDTPFDAVASWNGTCDNLNPIGAGAGVKSLSIAPLTVSGEACVPGLAGPPPPALIPGVPQPDWKTFALACHGYGWGQRCQDPGSVCLPKPTLMHPDFPDVCIFNEGARDCDVAPWSEPHVFYDDVEDHRACSECTCGPPTGSMCMSMLSVYENSDNTCGGPAVFGQLQFSSESPGPCHDLSFGGQALGSKSATNPAYLPGMCQPTGGEPIDGGTAEAINPVTFCCLPDRFR